MVSKLRFILHTISWLIYIVVTNLAQRNNILEQSFKKIIGIIGAGAGTAVASEVSRLQHCRKKVLCEIMLMRLSEDGRVGIGFGVWMHDGLFVRRRMVFEQPFNSTICQGLCYPCGSPLDGSEG